MNSKILLAFLGGALAASGIVFVAMRRPAPAAPAPTVIVPAPVATPPIVPVVAPAPVVAESKPAPKRAPVHRRKPVRAERPVAAEPAPPPTAALPKPPELAPDDAASPAEAGFAQPPASMSPPPPRTVTLAAGTLLAVRLEQTLSTDRNYSGDQFFATLEKPLVIDGLVIADQGARMEGRIIEAGRGGKVKGVAKLVLQLVTLHTSDGQRVAIRTASWTKDARTTKRKDAVKIIAASAIGAAIGALAGGGSGAATGAAVGGAAGTGDVLLTRGDEAALPVETALTFRVQDAVTITEKLSKS